MLSETPARVIDPLVPEASEPKSILVLSIPVVTSTPTVSVKFDLPYPDGKDSVLITILSVAISKLFIVTSPSLATGTPFANFTEYSNTSPSLEASTVPEDRSTLGDPSSASSSAVVIETEEESETPFKVIEYVESF